MPRRAFLMVAAFWVLLTFITPTLIIWSSSGKPGFVLAGEERGDFKARKMMANYENEYPLFSLPARVIEAGSPSPSPSASVNVGGIEAASPSQSPSASVNVGGIDSIVVRIAQRFRALLSSF